MSQFSIYVFDNVIYETKIKESVLIKGKGTSN